MARVTVTEADGTAFVNPAALAFEVPKGGTLGCIGARYCVGEETRDADEYDVLCWVKE
jgi:hypothetical protein